MRDERMYLVAFEWNNGWTLVKGANTLAKLLEPYIVATEERNSDSALRAKMAKAMIRAQLERTTPSPSDSNRNNRQLRDLPNTTHPVATEPVDLASGSYTRSDGRTVYGRFIDRISAVYQLHAPVE